MTGSLRSEYVQAGSKSNIDNQYSGTTDRALRHVDGDITDLHHAAIAVEGVRIRITGLQYQETCHVSTLTSYEYLGWKCSEREEIKRKRFTGLTQ